jgi:hypothetical protein
MSIVGSEWDNIHWVNDPRFAGLKPVTTTAASQDGVKVAMNLKIQPPTTTTLQ